MTGPTIVPSLTKQRFIPELRSPWWAALLVVSLMGNLLVGGAAVGAKLHGRPMQQLLMANRPQLLPRNFFFDLPRERRRELMDIVRKNKDQLAENRTAADQSSLKLADALEQTNFDLSKAKSIVEEFTLGNNSFAARGNDIIMEIISKLTPEERKKLAEAIRVRSADLPKNKS